jgi:hypothetical protein
VRNHKLRVAALVAVFMFVVGLAAIPQAKQTAHVSVPTIEPRAQDVSSIDNIVQASYETISGAVGVPRQWSRDRSLYDPNVRFVYTSVNPETKGDLRAFRIASGLCGRFGRFPGEGRL